LTRPRQAFDRAMADGAETLVRLGLWLTFKELRLTVFRTFLLRYFQSEVAVNGKCFSISLLVLQRAMAGLMEAAGLAPTPVEAVAGLVQRLLMKGYLKGFVHSQVAAGNAVMLMRPCSLHS
jgi:hypothetical protein